MRLSHTSTHYHSWCSLCIWLNVNANTHALFLILHYYSVVLGRFFSRWTVIPNVTSCPLCSFHNITQTRFWWECRSGITIPCYSMRSGVSSLFRLFWSDYVNVENPCECLTMALFCESKKNCFTTIEGWWPVCVVNLYWARGSNHQANHKPATTELILFIVIDFFLLVAFFIFFYVVKADR